MTTTTPSFVAPAARRLWPGLLIVIYGAVQLDGALLTAAYRDASPVDDDRLSYPWDGAAAVTTSLVWGVAQALFLLGLVAFASSGCLQTRAGRRGAWVAVVGAGLYVLAHAASVPFRDVDLDDGAAIAVLSLFGAGTLVTAAGMVAAGLDVLRGGGWTGWRRWSPLAFGAWLLVLLPLQFTPALPVAIAVYAAVVVAFGVALIEESLWRAPAA